MFAEEICTFLNRISAEGEDTMRIGSLVFTTYQGLGILAKSFFDNGIVTDVMTVHHGRREEHPEWYPEAYRITDLHSAVQTHAMQQFCKSMDAMLFFESPFNWSLLSFCRDNGVRTALMPMYECMPKTLPDEPDLFLCPSQLDRKSTRLNSSHIQKSRMPSSA